MRNALLWFALAIAGCQSAGGDPPARGALEAPSILAELDDASRQAVASSPVPVLLLPAEWSARSTVTAGRGFYAVSARDGELTVSIHATDVVHHRGDGTQAPPREHTVRGKPALMLVNEGIRSVTWEEGRTSYVLELECYRPMEDPRCTEESFVLELADALVEVER